MANLIRELLVEHVEILKKADEIKALMSKNILPLPKPVVEKLNDLIPRLADHVLDHASKEDKEILPLLRGDASSAAASTVNWAE